jgi:hypothetical protein
MLKVQVYRTYRSFHGLRVRTIIIYELRRIDANERVSAATALNRAAGAMFILIMKAPKEDCDGRKY